MSVTLEPSTRFRVRRFHQDDYPAILDAHNAQFPDYKDTPEQWRFYDERRDSRIRWGRFVAEDSEGRILGAAYYGQSEDMYHPQKFHFNIYVQPEFVGNGVGNALYQEVCDAIAEYDPLVLRTNLREDYTRGVRFLADRGFVEEMRDWESRLDPATWDPEPWQAAKEKVAAQGIVIKSLEDLARTDPDRDQKLYEMDWLIVLDMPTVDTLTKPSFDHFQKHVLENPDFLPAAWFIALDGDRYVGESCLWKSSTDSSLYVGATGVLREYRRRGIATALKIHALEYARQAGAPLLKTWNAQINRAMLSINEALGFEKQPAWVAYIKTLKTEGETV